MIRRIKFGSKQRLRFYPIPIAYVFFFPTKNTTMAMVLVSIPIYARHARQCRADGAAGLGRKYYRKPVAPFFQVIALPFLYDGIEKRCVGTVLGSREAVTSLRSARFLPGTEGEPRTEGFRSGKGRGDVSSDFLERGEEATLVSLLSSSLNR